MRVVQALSKKQLNVCDAQIITTKNNMAMDSFVVLEQNGEPLIGAEREQDVLQEIEASICSQTPIFLPRTLPRKLKNFKVKTKIKYIKDEKTDRTILELIALDRPCLLADVSMLFHQMQLQLHSAKIATVGERAEDVFTISNSLGLALTNEEEINLKNLLLEMTAKK